MSIRGVMLGPQTSQGGSQRKAWAAAQLRLGQRDLLWSLRGWGSPGERKECVGALGGQRDPWKGVGRSIHRRLEETRRRGIQRLEEGVSSEDRGQP